MATELYVQHKGKWLGPFSGSDVKKLAVQGKITGSDMIRKGVDGKAYRADTIPGLFDKPGTELIPAPQVLIIQSPQSRVAPQYIPIPPALPVPLVGMVECEFCGEDIKPHAKKCKHCGEILDPALRGSQSQQFPNIQTVVAVQHAPVLRWNKGTAMLLSILLPGAGHIYKGDVLDGIV